MFRIWAKVMKDGHIVRQTTYAREEKYSYTRFFEYLTEISGELGVRTPVLLKAHIFNYAKFNHVAFRSSDFMESVPFDRLVLENIL